MKKTGKLITIAAALAALSSIGSTTKGTQRNNAATPGQLAKLSKLEIAFGADITQSTAGKLISDAVGAKYSPDVPASKGQITYMTDNGIEFGDGVTTLEASITIGNHNARVDATPYNGDAAASEGQIAFMTESGIAFDSKVTTREASVLIGNANALVNPQPSGGGVKTAGKLVSEVNKPLAAKLKAEGIDVSVMTYSEAAKLGAPSSGGNYDAERGNAPVSDRNFDLLVAEASKKGQNVQFPRDGMNNSLALRLVSAFQRDVALSF